MKRAAQLALLILLGAGLIFAEGSEAAKAT